MAEKVLGPRKKADDSNGKADIQGDAHGEKFHPIKQIAPNVCSKPARAKRFGITPFKRADHNPLVTCQTVFFGFARFPIRKGQHHQNFAKPISIRK